MKKNILFVAILFISVLAFSQPPQEQGGKEGSRRMQDPEQMAKRQTEQMVKELGLDEKQAEKVEAINLDFSKKMKSVFEESADDRSSMRTKMETLRKEQENAFSEILTEEQLKKYKEMIEERMQERKSRQSKGERGGGRGQQR